MARVCRFLMCIETESSFSRGSTKVDCLSVNHNQKVKIKNQKNQKFVRNFLFDKSTYGATFANACSFLLAFIHVFEF